MEEILLNMGNYGFPMVVAAYLLVRVEKKLEMLTTAIQDLRQAVNLLHLASGQKDGAMRSAWRTCLPGAAEAGEEG
jgi:hypothetical protein